MDGTDPDCSQPEALAAAIESYETFCRQAIAELGLDDRIHDPGEALDGAWGLDSFDRLLLAAWLEDSAPAASLDAVPLPALSTMGNAWAYLRTLAAAPTSTAAAVREQAHQRSRDR